MISISTCSPGWKWREPGIRGLAYPHWVQDANYGAGEPRLMFYPPASWLLGGLLGTISGWHAAPVSVRAAGAAGRRSQHVPAGAGMGVTRGRYLCRLSLCRQSLRHVRGLRTLSAGRVAGRRLASSDGLVCLKDPVVHCAPRLVGGCPVADQFARRGRGQLSAGSPRAGNVDRGRQAMAGSSRCGRNGAGPGAGRVLHHARGIRTAMGTNRSRDHTRGCGSKTVSSSRTPQNAFHDQVLWTASWIFIAEVAVAAIAAYLAWRKRAGGGRGMVLTALLPLILLLQLPVSDVIWKHTPHMKFLQFPWRWMLALSVVTCVLAGMALDEGPCETSRRYLAA